MPGPSRSTSLPRAPPAALLVSAPTSFDASPSSSLSGARGLSVDRWTLHRLRRPLLHSFLFAFCVWLRGRRGVPAVFLCKHSCACLPLPPNAQEKLALTQRAEAYRAAGLRRKCLGAWRAQVHLSAHLHTNQPDTALPVSPAPLAVKPCALCGGAVVNRKVQDISHLRVCFFFWCTRDMGSEARRYGLRKIAIVEVSVVTGQGHSFGFCQSRNRSTLRSASSPGALFSALLAEYCCSVLAVRL